MYSHVVNHHASFCLLEASEVDHVKLAYVRANSTGSIPKLPVPVPLVALSIATMGWWCYGGTDVGLIAT